MNETMQAALDYIISNKQIKTVFQPIISLRDGSVLGHEALSRIICESEIRNAEMLFTTAEMFKRLWELELLCRTTALEAAYKFMVPPYNKKLFINVNPNTIHDENFRKGFTREFLSQYEIAPGNVIFEITERNVITDMKGFISTISHYRDQDFRIAIDDAGAGYSGLNLISDVNPNYIKLDMKLIRDIDVDNLKYALVKGLVEFSKASNINLIAEGIETFEELDTLVNLGVQYGQGYLIQKPDSEVKAIGNEVLDALKKINLKRNHIYQSNISDIYIKNLCNYIDTVSPGERVSDIYNTFVHNPDCVGLCVVDNGMPVGIVTQEKLAFKLSGNYGYALYQNKPISKLMDNEFLSFDHNTPVSVVSSAAMSRVKDKLYDFIVITENDKYIGTVTIKDLLKKTTEIEVSAARHQNPLSGLPGNLIIEQKLSQCIENNVNYSIAYLDIDNFKAYNDVYGFENGDLIIKLLADILRKHVSCEQFVGHIGGDDFAVIVYDHVTEEYFHNIGHIGGDDFAVIVYDHVTEEYFHNIEIQFEHEIMSFYNQTDIQNGYITTTNRHGQLERFPLTTLTTVVVNNKTSRFNNVFELTAMLAALKKIAKQNQCKHSC